jgi:hypothetical protein
MSYPAEASIPLLDFPGLKDVDPRDLEPGEAEEQTNMCSLVMGEMDVRQGYRVVKFENT